MLQFVYWEGRVVYDVTKYFVVLHRQYSQCKAIKLQNPNIQIRLAMQPLHRLPTLCLILFTLFYLSYGRQLEVPVVRIPTQHAIKFGRLQQIREPDFQFKTVQSRQVFRADGQMSPFEPCRENKPEVQFEITDKIQFENHKERPYVIYKFEDIQYSQYLLDTFVDQNRIYMIFEDGVVATVDINDDKSTKNLKVSPISGLSQNAQLEPGYFLKINQKIIFINNKYAILVNGTNPMKIEGYEGGKNFVTAIDVQNKYIAIAFEDSGVVFYKYENDRISHQAYIPPVDISQSGSVQITDLAYYSQQKSLFVLDQNIGATSFNLIQSADKNLTYSVGSFLLKRQACDLMTLFNQTLYLVCNQIYRISLVNWPKVEEKTLPHPNIKIRQIYVQGPLVAFVGRNIFKLMYLDRMVNYFEDQRMDKLIFRKDLFISANEGSLLVGKYEIVQPYITCQTQNQAMIGTHPLIFKTVAECNQQFFNQFNVHSVALNSFGPQDTCVYSVERTLYFWKTGQIAYLPIIITFSILLFIILTVLVIWVCKKCSISRFRRQLEEYTSLKTGDGGSQNHQNLVEEVPESGNNKSGASNIQNEDEQPKQQNKEYNVEMQNHDIE